MLIKNLEIKSSPNLDLSITGGILHCAPSGHAACFGEKKELIHATIMSSHSACPLVLWRHSGEGCSTLNVKFPDNWVAKS